LIRLRNHGVNAAYIQKMKARGYNAQSLDEWIDMRNRGVRD